MNVHDFVGANINMKRVKELAIQESKFGDQPEEGYYLFDIVSGSYGQYQQKAIAEFFGTELDEDGIADTDSFIEEVEGYLTEHIGLDGSFVFGYLESDGAFGLFYIDN